ncbi:class I SAM-dependent methyltransferase [Geobacter sp. DSM 9736]|uniref:class I SAM-dependent methyltransferase n=1 Tax=Geobacter sp. DSM 9736 TaxID=1277350 RepID=UPI000B51216F|nr:class I SAM-dependent methyltransferase [Geobacter sp. DSM 9736]SNB46602.1 Methyltransferase domain-containing protein [Geobacter sp. DSM 9736]
MSAGCTICGGGTVAEIFRATILGKHNVAFNRCGACGFISTEKPYWLDEAYSQAITKADVGLVQRNMRRIPIIQALIGTSFRGDGRFVDYGGGYGLFVRMMRDRGFDFYRYDRHCENLFAEGFEANGDSGGFELVTAMELFEHLVDPVAEVEQMLRFSRSIFFTTELVPDPPPAPGDWWYYGLDHGQHVSFYTKQSLTALARRLGLRLYSDGKRRHLLTERKISPILFRLATTYKSAIFLAPFFRRTCLVPDDYLRVTGHSQKGTNL